MVQINLMFAWAWILTGMASGALIGLFFYRRDFLGGFDAWPRRMVRLAHIAFLGTGLLNLGFALSAQTLGWTGDDDALVRAASWLLIAGAVAMPTVCLLSAWQHAARHLFFVPVLCLVGGVAAILWRGVLP